MVVSTDLTRPAIRSRAHEREILSSHDESSLVAIRDKARQAIVLKSAIDEERIEIFRNALRCTRDNRLKHVQPRIVDDTLHLEGETSSFYVKQLAQELIRPYTTDMRVSNDIKVIPR